MNVMNLLACEVMSTTEAKGKESYKILLIQTHFRNIQNNNNTKSPGKLDIIGSTQRIATKFLKGQFGDVDGRVVLSIIWMLSDTSSFAVRTWVDGTFRYVENSLPPNLEFVVVEDVGAGCKRMEEFVHL